VWRRPGGWVWRRQFPELRLVPAGATPRYRYIGEKLIYVHIKMSICFGRGCAGIPAEGDSGAEFDELIYIYIFLSLMSYNTHTQKSRSQSEKHCRRRGASSGHLFYFEQHILKLYKRSTRASVHWYGRGCAGIPAEGVSGAEADELVLFFFFSFYLFLFLEQHILTVEGGSGMEADELFFYFIFFLISYNSPQQQSVFFYFGLALRLVWTRLRRHPCRGRIRCGS